MESKEKILAEIEKRKLCTMDEHMKFYSKEAEADYNLLSEIENYINSLPEEPVSEDLDEALEEYTRKVLERTNCLIGNQPVGEEIENAFKAGAKWQKAIDNKAMETADKAYFESCEKIRRHTVEKALEWLKFNLQDYAGEDSCRNSVPFDKEVFEAFRKAMKED